jgi:hypothetical protein
MGLIFSGAGFYPPPDDRHVSLSRNARTLPTVSIGSNGRLRALGKVQ